MLFVLLRHGCANNKARISCTLLLKVAGSYLLVANQQILSETHGVF